MLRDRLLDYYGGDCTIVALKRGGGAGASLFVVDWTQRGRLLRTLGTVGRRGVIEHSGMDLLHPERLVFVYDRMMLVAMALAPQATSVLLLGLGGGGMVRHLSSFFPQCALTIVERDPLTLDLARRHFLIDQEVEIADAVEIVGRSPAAYDVVMVDLYDAGGLTVDEDGFWEDCRAALKPGGCLAINWAGFLDEPPLREDIAAVGARVGPSFFVIERSARPNMVQFAGDAAAIDITGLSAKLKRFARERRLPREDGEVLQKCDVLAEFPRKTA
jgi:spermidine synthase